ncbi:MAG: glutamine--fructose-6-phosphate transaminase (isomerizing) [Myxococcales bacterium]|nr:glutamine--fructose-6-phosphate transaminase (isomerizing) [Myxococcales bacterium]MCB9649804.1 glutamine--fructose-6-phosphate transaminase (isomerizing) [Deltaproteobacteria bacterium]
MCGIVGYIGDEEATGIIVEGLRRLEYRGYDSAGVAVVRDGKTTIRRAVGKLKNLDKVLLEQPVHGTLGIGHTRWATHGRPSEQNAHPHEVDGITVVHNGIIENYLQLRQNLVEQGRTFKSETDTEIMAHLVAVETNKGTDLITAVKKALAQVRGAYAFLIQSEKEPDKLITAKNASPIVIGYGEGRNYVASDIPALLEHTRKFCFLKDGQMAVITREGVKITTEDGEPVEAAIRVVDWSPVMAEKGGHKHFMHKEIFEQPSAIADTIRGRVRMEDAQVHLDGMSLGDVTKLNRLIIAACGTSYHAGLVGKFMIEGIARIPVEVDLAGEFRYRSPVIDEATGVLAISQSGETADTLAAIKEAKTLGATVFAVCNVIESSIARECMESGGVMYTHAGPEIGVASTKAFTTQLVALYLLAVYLGRARGTLEKARAQELLTHLREVPQQIERVLSQEAALITIARRYHKARDFLYLGRGPNYPIALEGALKLKEISYIHAEGYSAGEMKHGPIALIDEHLPTVGIATQGPFYEKTVSNLEEVKARDGKLIIIATEGDSKIAATADDVVLVPANDPLIDPILTVVPMQLIAYHIADLNGTDVDQPRNLAKSVTVE